MDLKSLVVIDVKKGDHTFSFHMPVGAPFGQSYDAAFDVLQKILELAREAAENAQRKD